MQRASSAADREQEQAVARRTSRCCCRPAPGSGKTSVLVERFVRAVREDGLAPARILAITFTERAAGELRERVRGRLLALGEREAARDTEAAFVSTFHGFCARLLRAHPLLAGLDPSSRSSTRASRRGCANARSARRSAEFARRASAASAVDLLAAYGADRVRDDGRGRPRGAAQPRAAPAAAARAGRGAAEATRRDAGRRRACALLDELLLASAAPTRRSSARRGAVDFDDLELLRARAARRAPRACASAWAERFELLMVDEFQDTNPRQLAILQALERGNLFTVGDELQSIYGFRHADVRPVPRAPLPSWPSARARSLALARNFRSRRPLLEVVNAVFARALRRGLHAARGGASSTGGRPGCGAQRRRGRRAAGRAAADRQARLGGGGARPGDARACRRRASGARPRRACWPSAWPSSCAAARRGRARWWCCCARSATSRSTSARCS